MKFSTKAVQGGETRRAKDGKTHKGNRRGNKRTKKENESLIRNSQTCITISSFCKSKTHAQIHAIHTHTHTQPLSKGEKRKESAQKKKKGVERTGKERESNERRKLKLDSVFFCFSRQEKNIKVFALYVCILCTDIRHIH